MLLKYRYIYTFIHNTYICLMKYCSCTCLCCSYFWWSSSHLCSHRHVAATIWTTLQKYIYINFKIQSLPLFLYYDICSEGITKFLINFLLIELLMLIVCYAEAGHAMWQQCEHTNQSIHIKVFIERLLFKRTHEANIHGSVAAVCNKIVRARLPPAILRVAI